MIEPYLSHVTLTPVEIPFTPDMSVRRDGMTMYQDSRSDHLRNHDANLLAAVKENACFYTAQQLKDEKRARELYHILGAPSVPTFKSMLRMNVIKNCPMISDHIDIAEKRFGTDVATLKGKTTRKQTPNVLENTLDVPEELYKLNSQLELYHGNIGLTNLIQQSTHWRT